MSTLSKIFESGWVEVSLAGAPDKVIHCVGSIQTPGDGHHARFLGHAGQSRGIDRVPGTPTALDQDPLTVLQHQRCEDPKPGPALMGAIAQKEGVLVLPLAFECHRMKLNLPAAGIGWKSRSRSRLAL